MNWGWGRICSRQRDEERIRVLDGQTDGERGGGGRVDLGVLAEMRYLNEPIKVPSDPFKALKQKASGVRVLVRYQQDCSHCSQGISEELTSDGP